MHNKEFDSGELNSNYISHLYSRQEQDQIGAIQSEQGLSIWGSSQGFGWKPRLNNFHEMESMSLPSQIFRPEQFLSSNDPKSKNVLASQSSSEEQFNFSDMLKTNCRTQKQWNYLPSFQKFTIQKTSSVPIEDANFADDVLMSVSNRKLQNRQNSRRARQKKKEEIEKMKQIINELKSQNNYLKSQSISKFSKRQVGSDTIYCKRCKKQMQNQESLVRVLSLNKYTNKLEKTVKIKQKNLIKLQDPGERKLKKQNFRGKGFNYRQDFSSVFKKQNKQLENVGVKNKSVQGEKDLICFGRMHEKISTHFYQDFQEKKQITQQIMDDNSSESQMQFEEMDFGVTNKNDMEMDSESQQDISNQDQIINNKALPKQKSQTRTNKAWTGKIWIALSVIMLVIGLQLHGLEGSGEKFIRINQKQAKQWLSDFQDPNIDHFSIRMKTAYEVTDKSSTSSSDDFDPLNKIKFENDQKFSNKLYSENKLKTKNQRKHKSQKRFSRQKTQESDDEIRMEIDKDLLFSIHAELNDIGVYL